MASTPGQRPDDEEQVNWGPFLIVFGAATVAFLVWLAFTWKPR